MNFPYLWGVARFFYREDPHSFEQHKFKEQTEVHRQTTEEINCNTRPVAEDIKNILSWECK